MLTVRPSPAEFAKLARTATVVPVWTELPADLETPVSAFLKLDDGQASFLLESVEGQERIARYSFLGSRPKLLFSSRGREVTISERAASGRLAVRRRFRTTQDPLVEIQRLLAPLRPAQVDGLPRLTGGLVGYLGYDLVRFFERLPAHRRDPLRMPEAMLMLTESLVIFDHVTHTMILVANAFTRGRRPAAAYAQAVRELRRLAGQLQGPSPRARETSARGRSAVRSNTTKPQFERMVRRAKEYIRAGDIIQVVLSQRFERSVACKPFDVYRALRSTNPSPYMFFLRFGTTCLVGSSPEMLVRCEAGHLETRPIAGTRRRGEDEREDEKLAQQLLASPKERAEHLMLVDLGRNDLGRVAATGSVRTPDVMIVEKYSHVMHLVSTVHAKLARGRTAADALRAAFPAGTVAGAPKVRAMQIIAELERDARGPYAGAVGYFSFSGNLDTCITIRTLLLQGARASVQAGAGIVADSNPEREYQETVNKAKACLAAIELAEQRFGA